MYGGRHHYNHSHHPHHHYPNHHHKGGPPPTGTPMSPESALAADIFEQFSAASTFKSVLHHYRHMCDVLRLKPQNFRHFYPKLKSKIRSWKAQALWTKFDKRASHKCYNHGKACTNIKVLIIGAGPCGLRTAIEAQLLGAKVVVVEKRDRFSRNNVLHLWPFVITDLKALGAKKFYGKFCAGAIDHISIRQLQCILLKVALLLGVEVFEGVTFDELLEPPQDQSQNIGWHARFSPMEHPVNQYEFDVLIGADGKRNTLTGFRRKEFRGKLAIAITANFINKHSEQEACVQEISGVAFIFNQKFFKDLYAETGIDLENIVYYKDETHYFVMTAKKHSLIDKGVILRDLPDTQQLLHPNNVDRQALCDYAREAADFSTGYQMPHLDFAVNHYGKPDIAMFDFTSMFAAENACRMVEKGGHKLLQCLVGDSLLEPFWPTGSGCARGFLSSFDACWAIRSWASNKMTSLEVIAERESIYRLLAQTTPENLSKDYSSYTLEPSSRYPTINLKVLLPFQVRHLYISDEPENWQAEAPPDMVENSADMADDIPRKRKRRDSLIQPDALLSWCQKQVAHDEQFKIEDLSRSFKDGRALCTILHRYRPDLLDLENLDSSEHGTNSQLAFDIIEREFGIAPIISGLELANADPEATPDLISYIAQIHDALRGEIPHSMGAARPPLKVLKGDNVEDLDLEDFPGQSRRKPEKAFFENISSSSSISSQNNLRVSCRLLDEPKPEIACTDNLQKLKKRRNEFGSLDANAYERHQDIDRNRELRQKKLKEQRELNTVRFIRSMRMLHCDIRDYSVKPANVPAFRLSDDPGIAEYRKSAKSMREKALELERKLYFPDKMNEDSESSVGLKQNSENFNDRVKGLEAKFRGDVGHTQQKPKDMIRTVGKLEKTDWNISAIERKIEDNPKPISGTGEKERLPKWSRDTYKDKCQNIERRLRENGEDEERIAKYLDIDASLKRLERKLREGSTLETGLRGHNKVSNLANQLSSKLVRKEDNKTTKNSSLASKQARAMVMPTRGSDLCYFCNTKVYLVERLNAEGKYFHRQCFKCNYCGAMLRLGNYIYDRENRYGGKFFCIPHFGLTVRARGPKKTEDVPAADKIGEPNVKANNVFSRANAEERMMALSTSEANKISPSFTRESKNRSHHLTPPSKGGSPLDRGTTPERVEFENSVIEHSDEEEYLSEDEWTDRNFGASANELDDDDDDSDYSDLSDEEVDEEALLETSQKLTVDETRRLAESWKRRYSTDVLEMSDGQESLSESENDDLSEHGAEGDESHTPTEGEAGDDDDDDEDDEGDNVRRARELRRQELNINVEAPPRKAETSDSGSETEVGSDEESDTQIDTDSEFAEDLEANLPPKEIPTIVIDEMPKEAKEEKVIIKESRLAEVKSAPTTEEKLPSRDLKENAINDNEGTERSASMSNLHNTNVPNPHTEQLKRLLQRTESTEFVSAQRNHLRRQYLLGNTINVPRKSVSTADLGNKFKSFMDKISETQKKLNPAPQPSPAMQAYLNLSNKSNGTTSPSSFTFINHSNYKTSSVSAPSDSILPQSIEKKVADSKAEVANEEEEDSSDSSKSEEGKLITFSTVTNENVEPRVKSKTPSLADENVEAKIEDNLSLGVSQSLSPDDKSKGEKGTLDSEQSEKATIERELFDEEENENCISAKNVNLINAFNEEPVEAINIELINPENIVDPSTDSLCKFYSDDNVEAVFDQLANDAISELSHSKLNADILDVVGMEDDKELEEEEIADVSPTENYKLENNVQSTVGENIQDESGFKSMDDKGSSSEIVEHSPCLLIKNEVNEKDEKTIDPMDIVLSPETEAITTEADLSDWGDENEAFSINVEVFENEFSEKTHSANKPDTNTEAHKPIARIASLESLGDSDSAISVSNCVMASHSQPRSKDLVEPEKLDYMDTSDVDSSPEESQSANIKYNKLLEGTPTMISPLKEDEPLIPISAGSESPASFRGKINGSSCPLKPIKSKSLDIDEILEEGTINRSLSEPHCNMSFNSNVPSTETSTIESPTDSPSLDNSHMKSRSPGRYEGYIPRFKGRVTPFSLARDSIDVRKNSVSKPLFTPSKEDILEREKNEASRLNQYSTASSTLDSPQSSSVSSSSLPKPKDGDLVRDMVMSRISKKSCDRNRRGSRNALHLSLHSSSSSLFGSEPSLETSKVSFNGKNKDFSPEEFVLDKDKSFYNSVVPCEEEKSYVEYGSDISCKVSPLNKMVVNNHSEKKLDYSPRNILPATPLTHPEKFQKEDLVKRELFKSSPQLHQSSSAISPSNSFQTSKPRLSPDDGRFSQRFSSEFSILPKQNVSLSKSLINNACDPTVDDRILRITEGDVRGINLGYGGAIGVRERAQSACDKTDLESPKKDQNERLKELLEERRRKEWDDQRDVRFRIKDSCIQDCLEEYRQKRSSAPVLTPLPVPRPKDIQGMDASSQTRAQLGLTKRHVHRPSLLELESMQIFSSNRDTHENSPSAAVIPSFSLDVATSGSVNNLSTSSQPASSPPSPQKGNEDLPEKKSTKKSKDRERRRSLIQVVAGMFTKSDEKKKEKEKEKEETETDSRPPSLNNSISPPTSSSHAVPPKSPSVKERFSRLRLSRSKKKSPSDNKNRSASAGTSLDMPSSSQEAGSNSLSLPTSPSRTLFSFLSSSTSKLHDRSRNSTSGSSTSYFSHRFSPSCIKEENNSGDESGPDRVTTNSKESTTSTPSLRKQRAAMRAAKQAEQKRLRMAQEIQRQMEECEVKTRDLEEKGVGVEKALTGETHRGCRNESDLMKEWFALVHEKNALVRWQEELTVKAKELELEDRHLRLENELRQRMTSSEREKTREDIEREGQILGEIISIIEQKDALVNLMEEDRQRYVEEDRDLELVHSRKVLQRSQYERETGV